MRVVAIIQARMGSTRLPGKVLKPFGDHAVLTHVLRRTANALPGHTVLAVPLCDFTALAPVATAMGIPCMGGPEHDVIARYWQAAVRWEADVVVRVTADCPLVEPSTIMDVAAACVGGRSYYCRTALAEPRGLDVEAFAIGMLARAISARDLTASDREHVTTWIQRDLKWLDAAPPKRMRWTLDTPEDYAWFCRLAQHVNTEPPHPTTDEVLAYIKETGDVLYEPDPA